MGLFFDFITFNLVRYVFQFCTVKLSYSEALETNVVTSS